MMDAAEEVPQLVCPEKKPRADGLALWHSTTQAAALLIEILLCVGFAATLVCAVLVCKRWLGHASDSKFLSRFRKLHPPHLLGYYIMAGSGSLKKLSAPRFVPVLPQPPELTAVIRRLENYSFSAHKLRQCRNGIALTKRLE